MPLKTDYESLYIGGSWVKPQGSETYTVINPATEEAIGEVPLRRPPTPTPPLPRPEKRSTMALGRRWRGVSVR